MENLKKFFKNQSLDTELSEDFEDIVFLKIRKRESLKKKIYSVAMIIIIAVMFLGLPFLRHNVFSGFAKSNKKIKKVNVPVIENMDFASSDNINDYAIEFISKDKKSRRPL